MAQTTIYLAIEHFDELVKTRLKTSEKLLDYQTVIRFPTISQEDNLNLEYDILWWAETGDI